jgi:uncharacterized C2H2 Zn-finger protein
MSRPYKCDICNMLFVNATELTKHEFNVHVDNMYQCQSCNKIFKVNTEFNRHIETHITASSQLKDSFLSTRSNYPFPAHDGESVESTLLKQNIKEKKAKRRTRGPEPILKLVDIC